MVDDPSRDQPLRGPDPRVVGIWREVTSAGHCRHPIHLIGERVDRETGEILPASVLLACKDRRAVLCPSCAAVYKADAWFLVTAGLTGGKGMTQNIKEHPRLFLTLTAPSFGLVHTIRDDGTCHPRRKQRCAHGRPRSCSIRHEPHHDDLGGPLCEDCFDFDGAVLWNAAASKLWNRTIDRARKVLAGSRGLTLVELRREAQLQYLRVAETQRRGLVHLHVVIRADGPLAASPPPPWLTPEVLERAVRQAVVATAVPTGLGGWARWGRQLDLVDIGSSEGDAARVAGYVAKYATKTTDGDFGLARRLPGRRGPGARAHGCGTCSCSRSPPGSWAISMNSRSCGSKTTPTRSASPGSSSPSRGASRRRSARCGPPGPLAGWRSSMSRPCSRAAISSPDGATATPEPRPSRSGSRRSMSRCERSDGFGALMTPICRRHVVSDSTVLQRATGGRIHYDQRDRRIRYVVTPRSRTLGPDSRPVALPSDIDDPSVEKTTGRVVLPRHVRWSNPELSYDLEDRGIEFGSTSK